MTFGSEYLCGRPTTPATHASEAEATDLRRDLQIAQRRLEEMSKDHEETQRRVVELSTATHALQAQVDSGKQIVLKKEEVIVRTLVPGTCRLVPGVT
jgi:uncharacterized protein (DUF3084 family)